MNKEEHHISEEKKELLEKADRYYHQLEEVGDDLQESSRKFGRNMLIIGAIGVGLFSAVRLLIPKKEKEEEYLLAKQKVHKPSRFTSALKSLALPFLVGVIKNAVFSEIDKEEKQK